MPSWNGRDGHSGIFLDPRQRGARVPGSLVAVQRRARDHGGAGSIRGLVGARVTAIGGRPIDDVLRLVEPLAPRDNPSNLLAYGAALRRRAASSSPASASSIAPDRRTFSLVDRDGKTRDVTIEPITAEDDVAWNSGQPLRLPPTDAPWLARPGEDAVVVVPRRLAHLFVQYNAVERRDQRDRRRDPGPGEEGRRRAGRRRPPPQRRRRQHDDRPFEDVLREPAIDRPGQLFVLIGRITFSAAANFATDLEQETGAIFAGEAMGGSPNLYGDARQIDLPYGGQRSYMATRYWERSTPDDQRITIEPDDPRRPVVGRLLRRPRPGPRGDPERRSRPADAPTPASPIAAILGA